MNSFPAVSDGLAGTTTRWEIPWSPGMSKPRILLADDHTLVAEAFSRLLEPQFEVVGTASDGRVLLEKAEQLRPDVILLDLSMPVLNGFEAGERLKKMLPQSKLI